MARQKKVVAWAAALAGVVGLAVWENSNTQPQPGDPLAACGDSWRWARFLELAEGDGVENPAGLCDDHCVAECEVLSRCIEIGESCYSQVQEGCASACGWEVVGGDEFEIRVLSVVIDETPVITP